MSSAQQVNLRKSHPGLFRSILTVAYMGLGLGLNFWFTTPTFNPYGVDKFIIGTIFALLGLSQILFLLIFRDLRKVRITLAVSISWMMFWGLSNSQQSFAGNASFQLPVLFITISILQIPLLIESPVNPITEKK